eukprot:COSAG04_NODE_598_length_12236_cov_8.196342_4_plen_76_part_00
MARSPETSEFWVYLPVSTQMQGRVMGRGGAESQETGQRILQETGQRILQEKVAETHSRSRGMPASAATSPETGVL